MNEQFVTICCRADGEGGRIDALRALRDAQILRGNLHLIFLVHGYNNTGAEACASYRAFCGLQSALSTSPANWTFDAKIATFFWPGDARWSIAKPAFYPWAIPVADAAAEVFGDILVDLLAHNNDELIVDFVAHSLGNRVVLRALAIVGDRPGLYVRRVVHMAAAVATWKLECDESDRLRTGLRAELAPGSTTSLYSRSDWVLADVFPVGETADLSHEGVAPIALGRDKWAAGDARLNQESAINAQHRDYWGGDSNTSPSVRDPIQRQVREALALASAEYRTILPYPMAQFATVDERLLESRVTPIRSAGTEISEPSCACPS